MSTAAAPALSAETDCSWRRRNRSRLGLPAARRPGRAPAAPRRPARAARHAALRHPPRQSPRLQPRRRHPAERRAGQLRRRRRPRHLPHRNHAAFLEQPRRHGGGDGHRAGQPRPPRRHAAPTLQVVGTISGQSASGATAPLAGATVQFFALDSTGGSAISRHRTVRFVGSRRRTLDVEQPGLSRSVVDARGKARDTGRACRPDRQSCAPIASRST